MAGLLITYAILYEQCPSADLSLTLAFVMMESCRLLVVCVLLFAVHSVYTVQIKGNLLHNDGARNELTVSNYINGENWANTEKLILDRQVDSKTLPSLTFANFKFISVLILENITLEHVPVFENTSISRILIGGTKIKSLPANAFSGPRPSILKLQYNEIHTMSNKSINIEAHAVSLACNKLTEFSQFWFEDPARIIALRLSGNQIEYIQDGAFNQMPKLTQLSLSYNRITTIGSESFGSGITGLHLDFNYITQLSADMFAGPDRSITYLYLHHNLLSFLPEALLLKLKPKEISIADNPWQCQCLTIIEKWIREQNSTLYDFPSRSAGPVCVVPRNFAHMCIPGVDTELQQTYTRALSPVPRCSKTPCLCGKMPDILTVYKPKGRFCERVNMYRCSANITN